MSITAVDQAMRTAEETGEPYVSPYEPGEAPPAAERYPNLQVRDRMRQILSDPALAADTEEKLTEIMHVYEWAVGEAARTAYSG